MKPTRTVCGALCSLCFLLGIAAPAARAEGGFVFVRSAKNASAKVSPAALRDLLTGRSKKWPSGPAVQLVLREEESPEISWAASTLFGTTGRALIAKVRQEVFKGEVRAPLQASSEEDTLAKVKANDGALGVVKEGTALPAGVALLAVEE